MFFPTPQRSSRELSSPSNLKWHLGTRESSVYGMESAHPEPCSPGAPRPREGWGKGKGKGKGKSGKAGSGGQRNYNKGLGEGGGRRSMGRRSCRMQPRGPLPMLWKSQPQQIGVSASRENLRQLWSGGALEGCLLRISQESSGRQYKDSDTESTCIRSTSRSKQRCFRSTGASRATIATWITSYRSAENVM